MPEAHPKALLPKQVAQPAAAGKRILQMQFIGPAHPKQIRPGDRVRPVVDAAAADRQRFGLLPNGEIVIWVDHPYAQQSRLGERPF